jgi:hypothetical protein
MFESSRKQKLTNELVDFTLMAINALTTTLRRSFDKRFQYIEDIPEGILGALELRRYYLDRLIQDYPEITRMDKKKIVNCIEQLIQKYRYQMSDSYFSNLPPEVWMDYYDPVNTSITSINKKYYDKGRQQWVDKYIRKPLFPFFDKSRVKKALLLGLITPRQLSLMPSQDIEYLFINDYGIQALREGLITVDQILKMPTKYIYGLFSNKFGIMALREKLITPEQLAAMPEWAYIYFLLKNEKGIKLLRQKLISPEQVAKMDYSEFVNLFL